METAKCQARGEEAWKDLMGRRTSFSLSDIVLCRQEEDSRGAIGWSLGGNSISAWWCAVSVDGVALLSWCFISAGCWLPLPSLQPCLNSLAPSQ
mgnify:CR=1 FL=1